MNVGNCIAFAKRGYVTLTPRQVLMDDYPKNAPPSTFEIENMK